MFIKMADNIAYTGKTNVLVKLLSMQLHVYVTARYATQPVSKPADGFRNRPAGFKMGRPDSRQLNDNGRL